MPELPEVETVVRQLKKEITGKTITAVDVLAVKSVRDKVSIFKKLTEGAKIVGVERRAKLIIIKLNNDWAILTHLKMTGKYIFDGTRNMEHVTRPSVSLRESEATEAIPVASESSVSHKHTRVIFHLGKKTKLLFNDMRRFGYLQLIEQKKLVEFLAEKYGPEPLDPDFTVKEFMAILAERPKAKIKPYLLEQKVIAGIGNIYAQEACFIVGVHPARPAGSLTLGEAKKLLTAIKKILNDSISHGGTTADDYLNVYGQRGDYAKKLKVYGRAKMPCLKCGTALKMMKLGGRGTVVCLNCQK